ncbi:expressed unknown protein [Seminavis robusta]|uniref:B30.2/SPRY domain-containing protein n=1 Tax=Seminavis robusta TaxID=568900 RepID=A0A9N8ELR0_9STRA|nr:expressed unknown protein [Seminavis robusta]|eukprot:Sro1364_g266470.1 n/a (479) ;mRNA; r:18520-19956
MMNTQASIPPSPAIRPSYYAGLAVKTQEKFIVFPFYWSSQIVSPGNQRYPVGTKAFENKLLRILREGMETYWDSQTNTMDVSGYLALNNPSTQDMALAILSKLGVGADEKDGSIKISSSGAALLHTETTFLDVPTGVNAKNYTEFDLPVHTFESLKGKLCTSLESRQKHCLKIFYSVSLAGGASVGSHKKRRGSPLSSFSEDDSGGNDLFSAGTKRTVPVLLLNYGEGYGLDLAGPKREINEWKAKALARIKCYRTAEDFVTEFESRSVFEGMGRLQKALMAVGPDLNKQTELAKGWAMALADDNDETLQDPMEQRKHLNANRLDADRKVCLQLLYSLYDCCMDDNIKGVDEGSVLSVFDKGRRVVNILHSTLVFDQAKALYFNLDDSTQKRGMHWYAKRHVETRDAWREIQSNYAGRPTINRRLVWYFDKLSLWNNPQHERLQSLMEPKYCDVHPPLHLDSCDMSFEVIDAAESLFS